MLSGLATSRVMLLRVSLLLVSIHGDDGDSNLQLTGLFADGKRPDVIEDAKYKRREALADLAKKAAK
jgi:hypothetical protein